jgi:hypothetical protein
MHKNQSVMLWWTLDDEGITHVVVEACAERRHGCITTNVTRLRPPPPLEFSTLTLSFEAYDEDDFLLEKTLNGG